MTLLCDIAFVAVECDNTVASTTNATANKTGHTYLSTIEYVCDEGHYLPDNESSHVSTCDYDTQWTITEDQICSREYPKTFTIVSPEQWRPRAVDLPPL